MTEYFHVSTKSYQVDEVVSGKSSQRGGVSNLWIENALDKYRDKKLISRATSVYAFKRLVECGYHAKKENISNPNYYRVSIESPIGHPYYLISYLRFFKAHVVELRSIVEEYWDPKEQWYLMEYLSEKLTILEIVDPPPSRSEMGVTTKLSEDNGQAQLLWPQP